MCAKIPKVNFKSFINIYIVIIEKICYLLSIAFQPTDANSFSNRFNILLSL